MSENRAILDCRAVSKTYDLPSGKVQALEPVSFAISAGTTIAVVGPSGSGKSTLLGLLGGLDRPSSGEIVFMGRPYSEMKPLQLVECRRKHIGFVFQESNLVGGLSVYDNVAMPLWLNGWRGPEITNRVDTLLETLGLTKLRNRFPRHLSGGEAQRVALCRAVAHHPCLLLADEPTGSLDHSNGEAVGSLLMTLAASENCAVVVATHNTNLADKLSRLLDLRKSGGSQ